MFKGIPKPVKVFLLRACLLFAVWKIIYILVLVPREIPDAWLVKRLGTHTASALSMAYGNGSFEERERCGLGDTFLCVQKEFEVCIGNLSGL